MPGAAQVGVIVAASRMRHPLEANTLARLAARHAGSGPGPVVGFGLSNDERRGVTEEFAHAFAIARRAGLMLVPHAGELLGAAAVAETLDAIGPERLGHGVRSVEDPRVLERVVREGVALEVCPLSNVSLGVYDVAEDVPLRTLVDAGARGGAGRRRPADLRVAAGRPVRDGAGGPRVLATPSWRRWRAGRWRPAGRRRTW